MWFTQATLDPKRVRAEQVYYDELRATFDDPTPVYYSYAPIHPLMIHGHVAENKAKQAAVLGALEHLEAQERDEGIKLAQEFEVAQTQKDQPKPGQPGSRPPGTPPTPGQPIYPQPPNVPGTPGYDPNKPATPPGPNDPQAPHEDKP